MSSAMAAIMPRETVRSGSRNLDITHQRPSAMGGAHSQNRRNPLAYAHPMFEDEDDFSGKTIVQAAALPKPNVRAVVRPRLVKKSDCELKEGLKPGNVLPAEPAERRNLWSKLREEAETRLQNRSEQEKKEDEEGDSAKREARCAKLREICGGWHQSYCAQFDGCPRQLQAEQWAREAEEAKARKEAAEAREEEVDREFYKAVKRERAAMERQRKAEGRPWKDPRRERGVVDFSDLYPSCGSSKTFLAYSHDFDPNWSYFQGAFNKLGPGFRCPTDRRPNRQPPKTSFKRKAWKDTIAPRRKPRKSGFKTKEHKGTRAQKRKAPRNTRPPPRPRHWKVNHRYWKNKFSCFDDPDWAEEFPAFHRRFRAKGRVDPEQEWPPKEGFAKGDLPADGEEIPAHRWKFYDSKFYSHPKRRQEEPSEEEEELPEQEPFPEDPSQQEPPPRPRQRRLLAAAPAEDLYAILGIDRTFNVEEIVKAARKKRVEVHPDRCRTQNLSPEEELVINERAKAVGQAADVLCDDNARAKYNDRVDDAERKARRDGY